MTVLHDDDRGGSPFEPISPYADKITEFCGAHPHLTDKQVAARLTAEGIRVTVRNVNDNRGWK